MNKAVGFDTSGCLAVICGESVMVNNSWIMAIPDLRAEDVRRVFAKRQATRMSKSERLDMINCT